MKIKMRTLCAGPGGIIQPGIRDVPESLARQLLASGAAEIVDETRPEKVETANDVETADIRPQEKAVSKKKRKR